MCAALDDSRSRFVAGGFNAENETALAHSSSLAGEPRGGAFSGFQNRKASKARGWVTMELPCCP
jgi:hypothetical protein